MEIKYPIRINKYLKDKGIVSRHEADKLIAKGQVLVNEKEASLGMMVNEKDQVKVKNNKQYKYFAYYKPRGLATQNSGKGKNVIENWGRKGVFPVGRLDKDSEGLLILTNDGRVTNNLIGEDSNTEKEYVVKVKEMLKHRIEDIFGKGMETETLGKLLPAKAKILNDHTLRVTLKEGKHHQIRIMLNDLHYTITELKRIRVGNIRLTNLKSGRARELSEEEIRSIFN